MAASEMTTSAAHKRRLVSSLEQQFAALHISYCELLRAMSDETLYYRPSQPSGQHILSSGESLLRGAAALERTFGGITANLWDDPFEWTLPEHLSTHERIIEYLEEVEETRQLAFLSFVRDEDLLKEIMGPAAKTLVLIDLLMETLVRATEYYGRAAATQGLLAATAGA